MTETQEKITWQGFENSQMDMRGNSQMDMRGCV